MALTNTPEHNYVQDSMSQEEIEEFCRLCTSGVFRSPSPPRRTLSTFDGPEMNSTLSSTTGEDVFTPSSSSCSEEQQPSPLNVDGFTFGADPVATSFQGPYPPYLDLSSPSNSSDGIPNMSYDGDNILNSPLVHNAPLSGQMDRTEMFQGAGATSWLTYPPAANTQGNHEHMTASSSMSDSLLALDDFYVAESISASSSSFSYAGYPRFTSPPRQGQIAQSMPFSARSQLQEISTDTNQASSMHLSPIYANHPISQSPTSLISEAQQYAHPFEEQRVTPFSTFRTGAEAESLSTLYPGYGMPQTSGYESYTSPSAEMPPYKHEYHGNSSQAPRINPAVTRNAHSQGQASVTPVVPSQRLRDQKLTISTGRKDNKRAISRSGTSRQTPPSITMTNAQSPASSTNSSPLSSTSPAQRRSMKGGRSGPLAPEGRKNAAKLRGSACWPCAVMREKCSNGDPCTRCASMSHRSKASGLGCDRRHLKRDMMPSFIPSSMDPGQQYADFMTPAKMDMSQWCAARSGISVPFSIGIGQPLVWVCHEYEPASPDATYDISWTIDNRGDPWKRTYARSPPLAIKSLPPDHLMSWMNRIVDQSLEDVGDMFYWEGHYMRTQLLKIICSLYDSLQKDSAKLTPSSAILRDDLRSVISLVFVTYVMNHFFTIEEALRDSVIRKLSRQNDPSLYEDMVILKTANAQLKYEFSKLRFSMHLALLNRLQTIMKHARYKEWWLSALVVMLGLALALEEYQHLLHIQADGQVAKGKDPVAATQQAKAHCNDIDDAFEFLLRLYHYKYSARSQDRASFDSWKSKTVHPGEAQFVDDLMRLFAQHEICLLQRKELQVSVTEDNHVLRLVGRFLTSFR